MSAETQSFVGAIQAILHVPSRKRRRDTAVVSPTAFQNPSSSSEVDAGMSREVTKVSDEDSQTVHGSEATGRSVEMNCGEQLSTVLDSAGQVRQISAESDSYLAHSEPSWEKSEEPVSACCDEVPSMRSYKEMINRTLEAAGYTLNSDAKDRT